MGAKERNSIIDAIKKIGKADAYEIYTAKVMAVDETNFTIEVEVDDSLTIADVRLKATIEDDNGMVVIPAINSYVTIAQLDGGVDFCLLRASTITKALLKIGNTTYAIDKDKVVFNGGNNKGLVIVGKAVERYNKIEKDLNTLKQIITAWTPVPSDGGAALKTALSSWVAQTLGETTANDIENDKVQH